eukprot:3651320-Lingulodinium_polyedra.AAC.1
MSSPRSARVQRVWFPPPWFGIIQVGRGHQHKPALVVRRPELRVGVQRGQPKGARFLIPFQAEPAWR